MKAMRAMGCALAMMIAAGGPALAEQKLGFVRSDEILERYAATKGAVSQLQQEIEGWRKEAAEMEQEVAALFEEYQSQSGMLSDAAKKQKEEKINRKRVALDEYVQRYFGPEGKAAKRRAELLRPVEAAILESIKVVAEREVHAMVFDASAAGVVWADGDLDLTESVIAELDSGTKE